MLKIFWAKWDVIVWYHLLFTVNYSLFFCISYFWFQYLNFAISLFAFFLYHSLFKSFWLFHENCSADLTVYINFLEITLSNFCLILSFTIWLLLFITLIFYLLFCEYLCTFLTILLSIAFAFSLMWMLIDWIQL